MHMFVCGLVHAHQDQIPRFQETEIDNSYCSVYGVWSPASCGGIRVYGTATQWCICGSRSKHPLFKYIAIFATLCLSRLLKAPEGHPSDAHRRWCTLFSTPPRRVLINVYPLKALGMPELIHTFENDGGNITGRF